MDARGRMRPAAFQESLADMPLLLGLTALLGTLPGALGLGNGAEARRALGIAAVGALLVSQLLTLLRFRAAGGGRNGPARLDAPRARRDTRLQHGDRQHPASLVVAHFITEWADGRLSFAI